MCAGGETASNDASAEIRAGDTVVCVDASAADYLTEGSLYLVTTVTGRYVDLWAADEGGPNHGYLKARFRKATPTAAPQPAQVGLCFSVALALVKAGRRIRRTGWNGKGMSLGMVPRSGLRTAYIEMKTADGSYVPWLASQTDLLSDDWETA